MNKVDSPELARAMQAAQEATAQTTPKADIGRLKSQLDSTLPENRALTDAYAKRTGQEALLKKRGGRQALFEEMSIAMQQGAHEDAQQKMHQEKRRQMPIEQFFNAIADDKRPSDPILGDLFDQYKAGKLDGATQSQIEAAYQVSADQYNSLQKDLSETSSTEIDDAFDAIQSEHTQKIVEKAARAHIAKMEHLARVQEELNNFTSLRENAHAEEQAYIKEMQRRIAAGIPATSPDEHLVTDEEAAAALAQVDSSLQARGFREMTPADLATLEIDNEEEVLIEPLPAPTINEKTEIPASITGTGKIRVYKRPETNNAYLEPEHPLTQKPEQQLRGGKYGATSEQLSAALNAVARPQKSIAETIKETVQNSWFGRFFKKPTPPLEIFGKAANINKEIKPDVDVRHEAAE